MRDFPIFLLPDGEAMMTAKVEEDKIKLLKKTLFPTKARFAISETGIAACLDKEKRVIIYGQLLADGSFGFYKLINFPDMISPKSICIKGNHLVLGGENNQKFMNDIKSHELVVTYDLYTEKFTPLYMPQTIHGKSIDDLLIDGEVVIGVDNIVWPKYILYYDFTNPYKVKLKRELQLPNNGSYESITKGSLSEDYIALKSYTVLK